MSGPSFPDSRIEHRVVPSAELFGDEHHGNATRTAIDLIVRELKGQLPNLLRMDTDAFRADVAVAMVLTVPELLRKLLRGILMGVPVNVFQEVKDGLEIMHAVDPAIFTVACPADSVWRDVHRSGTVDDYRRHYVADLRAARQE